MAPLSVGGTTSLGPPTSPRDSPKSLPSPLRPCETSRSERTAPSGSVRYLGRSPIASRSTLTRGTHTPSYGPVLLPSPGTRRSRPLSRSTQYTVDPALRTHQTPRSRGGPNVILRLVIEFRLVARHPEQSALLNGPQSNETPHEERHTCILYSHSVCTAIGVTD